MEAAEQTQMHGSTDEVNSSGETCRMCKASLTVSWIAQAIVALIYLQSLFFKFTYAPETQVIFEKLGGRAGATAVGMMELLSAVFLLVPRMNAIGAIFSLITIGGATMAHFTVLGVVVVDPATGEGDGGTLFMMAMVVAVLSAVILVLRRKQLPLVGDKFS
ncbi:MAG TPA: LPXTG cell wall anchor domain-containing protein [Phycisphaeraceae bacterium]|nr:LPXTG cell wall anchor domain-containing protein [Phycisphaeraceae bacterium]